MLALKDAAKCLEKLGNETRLEVVRLLVRAGDRGLAVGEIQDHLGIPASTLSHHVAHLVTVGLVRQEREGRILRCTPNYALLMSLVDLLTAECCRGVAAAQCHAVEDRAEIA
jgi:DNA-binding transcriptional ArsR family regulator